MFYSQSLIHSAYDSAESIATPPDSDIEDKQLRMMLVSPLFSEVSGNPAAESVQKREANAQRAQAYHSRRKSLLSGSSRNLEVSGPPDTVFSCHSESSQNIFQNRPKSRTVPGVVFNVCSELLKVENCEKCWLHHGTCKVEKTAKHLECHLHPGNLSHCCREESYSS